MTRYQLAWDDTRTGRLRADDSESPRPLAWLRVTWGAGHEVVRVDVYGDGATAGDRRWVAEAPTIRAAIVFCDARGDDLRPLRTAEPMSEALGDAWEHHSIVDVD